MQGSWGWNKCGVQTRRNYSADTCNAKRRENAGEDVHRVVRAKNEYGGNFKQNNSNSDESEPAFAEARQFDCAKNRDGGVAGKEKIVANVVGDEQRWKSGIVPDHIWRRGESANGLQDLSQAKKHYETEEWANAWPKKPTREEKKAETINQCGTEDE